MTKLINERTNEIVVFGDGIVDLSKIGCKNVAEMIEAGWKDYKESKQQYYIKENGNIGTCGAIEDDIPDEMFSKMKQIGNYFKTKEEAEKAVEKLKAWQRLKNKGFKFRGLGVDHYEIDDIKYEMEEPPTSCHCQEMQDLNLLFGGEE